MSFLAISYPELSQDDFDWIQSVREEYDELQYKIVNPHFTLIFETDRLRQREFVDHVASSVCGTPVIDFRIRTAIAVKNRLSNYTYVFLVPDKGHDSILQLHNRLYTGNLSGELLEDIPYIPHITVGNSINPGICEDLADRLIKENLCIPGRVRDIDIVTWRNNRIETIEKVELADKRSVDTS